MNRTLGVLATSVGLVAGLCAAASADEPTGVVEKNRNVVVKKDHKHDVRTKVPWAKEEKAPRFIKRSIDLEHARYEITRSTPIPKLRIVYKARNVLQANRRRNQEFQTDLESRWRNTFSWIESKGKGPVKVWYMDRGGARKVKCPRAKVKLRPGPRKNRVVHVVPLWCVALPTKRVYIRSSAEVLPFHKRRFVSSDRAPETGLIKIR